MDTLINHDISPNTLPSNKRRAFEYTNAIEELLNMASDRIWRDCDIKDQLLLAALVDAARAAGGELSNWIEQHL